MSVGPAANSLRLLVVDDRRDSALILKTLLELAGHEVELASDGQGALAVARTQHPHAIISDLSLDGVMDGCDLARAVRSEAMSPAPRLIALTGYADDQFRQMAEQAGFDHYLVKPPVIRDLLALLEQIAA